MQPTLSLVPPAGHAASVSVADTANSQGVHDTLRYGVRSLAADVAPAHPLQSRLENWDDNQEMLQLTLQRQMYGLHMPVRQLMERSIVKQSATPLSLGGFTRPSNLHLDILLGKDEQIDFSDVLKDRVETAEVGDFHREMEKKVLKS